MLEYMLDTDICIYVIKNRLARLNERFNAEANRICISSITLGELQYGAEKSQRRETSLHTLQLFADRLPTLAFDAAAALHLGSLRAELEAAGTPCGAYDTQIGAHARSRGLIVVTNNRREFDRMPGLRVENWV